LAGRLYLFYRDEWGRAARESFEAGLQLDLSPVYSSASEVVVCGMGGSGAAGDYLATLSSNYGGVPIYVVKGPNIPRWVSRRTLVIAVSFSGNTRETLNCAREASAAGAMLLTVTRGGRLGEWAEANGYPVARLSYAPAPRAGWPNIFYTLLGALMSLGLLRLPRSHVDESIRLMAETAMAEAEAGKIVSWLKEASKGLIAVVAPEPYYPAAIRFSGELAENAKLASDARQLPELGHNIIVGWSQRPDTHLLLLDPDEEPWTSLLGELPTMANASSTYTLKLQGASLLAKLVWATWIAGLASTSYAEEMGINPEETPAIKKFRSLVEEKTSWNI
jgi:glucose/mannose-6-phosphate isomerase